MKTTLISKYKSYIVYFLFLLVLIYFLMQPNSEISIGIRISILGLIFLPTFLKGELFPFTILCFYGISSSSFTPVLPTSVDYYLIFTLIIYIINYKVSLFAIKTLLLFAYFFYCSILNLDYTGFLTWWFICILLADMINTKENIEMLFYAFLLISLFLSILFIAHRDSFLMQYGSAAMNLERSGWINANVFGATIAPGGILSMSYLTGYIKLNENKYLKIICLFVFSINVLTLILNSSRGALLAFLIPSIIMLFISKVKLWYKLLFILLFIFSVYIYWSYNNNLFDLLFTRLTDDTAVTGGGRSLIWLHKLDLFSSDESSYIDLLFGIGQTATTELGGFKSTHNDFVSSFIGFGLIGFILFMYYIVIYPIKKAVDYDRFFISLLMIYIFIECCVLEPFYRGYIILIMFYIFVVKYVIINKELDGELYEN